jgi:predicted nuclease of restriction endonuclease-like (RecB) superfamily
MKSMPKKSKNDNTPVKATRSQEDKAKAVKKYQPGLLRDLRGLIAQARQDVARQVNTTLVALHWRIGKRIMEDILKQKRADYGAKIVSALGRQLEMEFGRGFSEKSLRHMIRFAEVFPDEGIVSSLMRQLTWTHFTKIIYIEDPLKLDFYTEMCRIEGWSTRTLEKKISGMLFERTALSKKPKELIRRELDQLRADDKLTPDLVFRDPYFLDFLGLKDRYLEKDLEDAIIRELEDFILELGIGFTFVARQKRIQVDNDDHYLDLLFYHRDLKRLVAIDLKLGDFKPADKGQMELYLRWLARHEQKPGEESPLGLILCAGKKQETMELLELEKSDIRVASYWTKLLPRKLLQRKLHEAILHARERLSHMGKKAGLPALLLENKGE